MRTDHRQETIARPAEGMPEMLVRRTAFLLARASLRARETLNGRLAGLGLHVRHFAVLAILIETPAAQVEMAERLCIDRTSMVSLLDELEALGLVQRTAHPQDRRVHLVQVTGRGLEVARAAEQSAEEAEAELLTPLTIAERKHLHRLLAKLVIPGSCSTSAR